MSLTLVVSLFCPSKIPIVTVVFNGGDDISRIIFSVLGQTHSPAVFIVIDGISTDCALDVIRRHEDRIVVVISEAYEGINDVIPRFVVENISVPFLG